MTPGSGEAISAGNGDEELAEEGFVAEQAVVAFDTRREAAAGEDLHVFGGRPCEAERTGGVKDGVGERVVGTLFGGGGDAEEVAFGWRDCFESVGARWRQGCRQYSRSGDRRYEL